MTLFGAAHVDDVDAMSPTLAEDVSRKAFKLLVSFRENSQVELWRLECQVGLNSLV